MKGMVGSLDEAEKGGGIDVLARLDAYSLLDAPVLKLRSLDLLADRVRMSGWCWRGVLLVPCLSGRRRLTTT